MKVQYQKEKTLLDSRSTNLIHTARVYPVHEKKELNELQAELQTITATATIVAPPSTRTQAQIASPRVVAPTSHDNVFARLNAEADRRQKRKKLQEQQLYATTGSQPQNTTRYRKQSNERSKSAGRSKKTQGVSPPSQKNATANQMNYSTV